ncbi:hypothetical protein [Streptomyces sp. Da 82-17]|uniref:hypothetical protein n=1 Tax=Streptomyces sp. Da 82-17 TaxID=3377116 RepID=UPI0038D48940
MATATTAAETSPELRVVPAGTVRRRARLERLLYGAATLGLSIGPHTDFVPAHLGAAVLGASAFITLWRRFGDTPFQLDKLRSAQKSVPAVSAAAIYLTDVFHPGAPWWELVLPVAWGGLMAVTTPLTNAARLVELPALAAQAAPAAIEAAPQEPAAASAPTTYPEYRQWEWANAKSTGTTLLTNVQQYTDEHGRQLPDFWGTVIAEQGEAVPDLKDSALAGVFDLPVGTVWLQPIEGSGPGRMHLLARPTLGREEKNTDPIHEIFNKRIARPGGGGDGMQLLDYRIEPNRIALRITAPDDQFVQLDQKKIARSLKYKDSSLVMVETDGLGDGVISIYKNHPLLTLREATVEDLTMAEDGTIAIGMRPDGREARVPLYDPQMGAITDLYVAAPGGGKSVSLLTLLAAERISGIVSIAADAQDGMSLPEADGRIYHFGKGIAATAATLAAAADLAKYREKVSAANGWGSFEIGNPWRLVNVTLDELNRILSADAPVPRPFRKWVAGLTGDTQATGRKLGEGIRFAAQSIHLADLGDKDRIRANAKNGTVWLGRTNSSTTQHMARDGVLPPGVGIEPIPRYFKVGDGSDIDATFHGKETKKGPVTAGMANIIQGGSVFLGRTWFARKENKTYPGLIKLMESAPIPRLSPEEDVVFQTSYARWLAFAEELLAGGDTAEGIDAAVDAEQAVAKEQLARLGIHDADEEDEQPSAGTIKDRILDLLADGQPWKLRDVRARLDDVSPASVNNAMAELHHAGHVTPISRGTYQIAPN